MRPFVPYDTKRLKHRVGNRWLSILEDLADELYEGVQHWGKHVSCPQHGGRDGFRLFPDADVTGGAVCNSCGFFNDGIQLLMWIKGWSFLETVEAIEDWLDQHEDDEPVVHHAVSASEARSCEPDPWAARYIDLALDSAIFGHDRIAAYLRHRGLSGAIPPYLGLLPHERYRDEFDDVLLPVMAGFFQAPDGQVVGVHRTFLDPDGPGKADVETPKKFSRALFAGALRGAAIRLRDHNGILGVAEGIETAEAVYQATGRATWATGSAGGMESLVPSAGVKLIGIWADNDRHQVGQRAAYKLAVRLLDAGLRVLVMVPPEVDIDWLDILNADGVKPLQQAAKAVKVYDPARKADRNELIERWEACHVPVR
ncbi:MAG: hypothetical protein FDZ69_00225 [Deltaproteobacteria bacterium]|nr:MAG: hypothetical protein FDZ69_00225 [Deltaproteobacteria bacterium]